MINKRILTRRYKIIFTLFIHMEEKFEKNDAQLIDGIITDTAFLIDGGKLKEAKINLGLIESLLVDF